jgi:hydrogenase nickel incorporation protein HypA/HybF
VRVHELVLAESALKLALSAAGAARVFRIGLRVGTLSGVDPEALRFALTCVTHGTAAEEAAIDIETVAAVGRCASCVREFALEADAFLQCPACGRPFAELRGGRELELSRVEFSACHDDSELSPSK